MEHFFLHVYNRFKELHLGLWFNKNNVPLNLNFHDHDFSELAIILEGSNILHHAEHKSTPLQVGDVLLLHPGMQHAYSNTLSMQIVNILFDASRLPLMGLDAAESVTYKLITQPGEEHHSYLMPIAHFNSSELSEVVRILHNLENELNNPLPARNLISLAMFMQVVGMIVRAGNPTLSPEYQAVGMDAVQYINENFTRKLTVSQLAKLSKLSERDFYRKFRAVTGMAPLEYKRKKQLELACHLLRTSRLSISEIADRAGFCDSNYLTKEFSKSYQMPPGKFRKNCRKA